MELGGVGPHTVNSGWGEKYEQRLAV